MKNQNSTYIVLILFAVTGFSGRSYHFANRGHSNSLINLQQAERNYVPDEKTAIAIAEAVWLPILGDRIYRSKPFTATLDSELVWTVKGTLNAYKGGVPYCRIQKKDGKIVSVYHTK